MTCLAAFLRRLWHAIQDNNRHQRTNRLSRAAVRKPKRGR
jgi:hypothetical protein